MPDSAYVSELLVLLIQHLDELIVEYAADINRSIVESLGGPTPSTYFNTFEELAEFKVIPAALAARLGATTGLRNRLVHGYEKVDHVVVHRALRPLHKSYLKYVVAIENYLTSHSE